MLLECCMRLDCLLVVANDEILDHVVVISNFLLASICLLCSHDLECGHSAILVVMDFLVIGDMLGIIGDPADIIRMFVKDIN